MIEREVVLTTRVLIEASNEAEYKLALKRLSTHGSPTRDLTQCSRRGSFRLLRLSVEYLENSFSPYNTEAK